MIRLEHVTKRFGNVLAVDDFSLDIDDGEVCILIGPSGSGKTTLLRMINRLIEPTSGRIFINGQDTHQLRPEKLRLSIGYVIQSIGLFPHMTVAANISIVPEIMHWDKQRIRQRVQELLELVGLDFTKYASKYPAELSGGEAQRIGVARALAADPPLLLMDEPFGSTDPLTRQRLQAEFVQLHHRLNKTIIFVTHDLDQAIRLADKIAIIKLGKLVQYDAPEIILSSPINKFVHDFVGVDRALKRLSRIAVEGFVKPSNFISINAPVKEALSHLDNQTSIWVIDENDYFAGWASKSRLLESSTIIEATVFPQIEEISIRKSDTLRDALSRMLGEGVRSLPVIDETKHLIGEITLTDIEKATASNKE